MDIIQHHFNSSTSSNYISALAKDNIGNIWIGTKAGLVKYDGVNFTTYNTTNGLPSNTITCIETIGNQVYVGTRSGLSRFDGSTFTNYTVANGKVPSDTITSIKAESATVIWLGGLNRLVQFNINGSFTTSSFVNNNNNNIPPKYPFANLPGNINCIYIDGSNAKWLGTTNAGVTIYNGSAFTNASQLYDIFGATIPNKIMDLATGLNNGVAMKMTDASWLTSTGILELAPNNKVYQYFKPIPTNEIGDYLEKVGTNLIVAYGKSFG
jgi:ligand-binding sensor domain-containing protein